MKSVQYLVSVLLAFTVLSTTAATSSSPDKFSEVSHLSKKNVPVLASPAWMVQDLLSQQVIASRQSQKRFAPNELSKLMVAYVLMKHVRSEGISLDQSITIPASMPAAKGLRLYLEPGSAYSLNLLLQAMLVMQADDASYALMSFVSSSEAEYVKKMNSYAQNLGMSTTKFIDINGYDQAQSYTTVNDMAILARALLTEFGQELQPIFKMPEFRFKELTYPNQNRLLWLDSSVQGMMASDRSNNYSLIAVGQRSSRQVLVITMGAKSDELRVQDSLNLFNWAFQNFQTYQFYAPRQVVSNLRIWKGATNTLRVGVPQGLWLTLPKELDASKVSTHYERPEPLFAPLSEGAEVGVLTIQVQNKVLQKTPLFVLDGVRASGWLKRVFDQILLWFSI